MDTESQLVRAIAASPDEDTPRAMLRDHLIESGRWDWAVVNSLVRGTPAADGLRLLAAEWLEGQPAKTFCRACSGEGCSSYAAAVDPVGRCNGSGEVPNYYAERAKFIRAQVLRSRMEPIERDWGKAGRKEAKAFCDEYNRLGAVEMQHGGAYTLASWFNPEPKNTRWLFFTYLEQHAQPFPYMIIRRGFAETASLSAEDWVSMHAQLTATHPITEVRLTTWPRTDTSNSVRKGKYLTPLNNRCCLVGMPWVETEKVVDFAKKYPGSWATDRTQTAQAGTIRMLLAYYWPGITFTLPGAV